MNTIVATRRITGHFLLARADALSLLLPLEGVGAVAHLDAQPHELDIPGLFGLGHAGDARLIVAPSERLRLLRRYPRGRFVLTPMTFVAQRVWIAWTEIRVLIGATIDLVPLPPAFALLDGPVDSHARIGGRPAFHTTPQRLLDFMLTGAGLDE